MEFVSKRSAADLPAALLIFIIILLAVPAAADQPTFDLNARSALLMEFDTGEILYQKNPEERLAPASMTKIMTMLLVMEALAEGKAQLDDKLVVSEYAAGKGGSQIWLEPGEEMTLEEMMKAVAIVSANDASVAVAEYLYGTEADFVQRMNERVKELRLQNTYFYNCSGLPPDNPDEEGNYTTAADLAVMAREILKHPRVLDWTSTWLDYLREGESVLNNTNRLVRHYQGADGLKTGYTDEAKFCVTSTAEREGLRFIAVIMAADNSTTRFNEAAQLLSYGFNSYRGVKIAGEEEIIQEVTIRNGREELAAARTAGELIVPVKKGEEDQLNQVIELNEELLAPLKKGDKIGELKVFKGNLLLKKADIVIDRDVEKASFLQTFYRIIRQMVTSLVDLFK